ncbi:hypothetical protein [uncultured Winogradskyella sp.]|nr:hypothetical protein [uncultured Winogradskyella sp.]
MTDFEKLVKAMRTAQKEFKKSKSAASREKSGRLERQVDAELEKLKG